MDTKQRLMELLAERATMGLDPEQAEELAALLDVHPEWDNDSFDLAAAAIDEALSAPPARMPESLNRRLHALASEFGATNSSAGGGTAPGAVISLSSVERGTRRGAEDAPRQETASPATGLPAWGGWLAAAAVLVLAFVGWWPRLIPVESVAGPAQEQREELIAGAADLVQLPWQATADPAAVRASGDVVWSGTRQEGFMRIRGLRANDPGREQYQLWVFDAHRDERYPVDGGVFDIPGGMDEVVVPIAAKLPVDEAVLFAVTVEAPGGVVVSDRERIVLLAQVDPGN